jgi:transcriptional regulator with XRE-family HTH domain
MTEGLRSLGPRIRRARLQRGLSLAQLSALSGFSPSFLSLVERNRTSPSLTSLTKLAEALSISASSLLPNAPSNGALVHRATDTNPSMILGDPKVLYRTLSATKPSLQLEPMLVVHQPLALGEPEPEPFSHRGEEFCYVLEGELVFRVEGQEFLLHPGDSIHVESSTLHVCFTNGPQPTRSLWVLTPRLM